MLCQSLLTIYFLTTFAVDCRNHLMIFGVGEGIMLPPNIIEPQTLNFALKKPPLLKGGFCLCFCYFVEYNFMGVKGCFNHKLAVFNGHCLLRRCML